jgi:hypothetical protein
VVLVFDNYRVNDVNNLLVSQPPGFEMDLRQTIKLRGEISICFRRLCSMILLKNPHILCLF